jgi:hypothetical protein
VLCKKKTYRKEHKLHCVSSSYRKQNILKTATHFMDNEMIYLISNREPEGIKRPSVAMLLLLRKKARENAGHGQNLLPVMATSGQGQVFPHI